jgi:hypothetical protein
MPLPNADFEKHGSQLMALLQARAGTTEQVGLRARVRGQAPRATETRSFRRLFPPKKKIFGGEVGVPNWIASSDVWCRSMACIAYR